LPLFIYLYIDNEEGNGLGVVEDDEIIGDGLLVGALLCGTPALVLLVD